MKTFARGWRHYQPTLGVHLWRTGYGYWYRVDHTGTHPLGTNPGLSDYDLTSAATGGRAGGRGTRTTSGAGPAQDGGNAGVASAGDRNRAHLVRAIRTAKGVREDAGQGTGTGTFLERRLADVVNAARR